MVILRNKDILVGVADLENAGLHRFVGTRESLDGKSMVSLASLTPAITFKFDDRDLTLQLVAETALLAPTDL